VSLYANNRGFSNGLLAVLALFVLAAVGVGWVSLGIVAKDRWPIRWLEVNGEFQRVSAEQLRACLVPLISSSFFTVDLQQLHGAAARLSWVATVNVQKKWPDTVSVKVREYVPFAHWNRGQLISSQGEAFAVPEADEIQGLPWLQGPQGQLEQVLDNWVRFNSELAPAGLEVDQLALDQRGAWSMVLNNGTRIQLGRESANERLKRLMSSWTSLLNDHAAPPQDVDLRYTNGFAVHWPELAERRAGSDT
jgi:cell division protein FtsQ